MKKKEKAYSIALASTFIILLSIFVSSTASALQTERDSHDFTVLKITNGARNPSGDGVLSNTLSTKGTGTSSESVQPAASKINETQITTSGVADFPAIYGNRIVWDDDRNGNRDIYMYDLSTKQETQITTNTSYQSSPDIYGDKIVWVDTRNGNQDIYMYDLSTKQETQITTDEVDQQDPAIYGNKIVWEEDRNWYAYIHVYDLSTKKETQITNGFSSYPAIYGSRIVWEDYRNGNSEIYMYDLSTSTETQITTNGCSLYPAIYSDRIVWEDWLDGDGDFSDIYMYNLSTKKETQITNSSSSHYPAIYGNMVVCEDYLNENWDIYVYDLSTGEESQTTSESTQCFPDIYGDKIVWVDVSDGNTNIYMGTLSTSSPVAALSASPTTGKAPLTVTFTDKSTGSPTSWKWTFGDGTTSTKQNITHKYSKVGKYTVSLTVKNAVGSNTVTKKDYIKVVTKPVAAFSANPTSGKAPLTVAFTDKSTGVPTAWKWSFGDGATSTQQNPKHQYLQEGNYKVTLTVTNAAGSSTAAKTNYIKVTTNTRPGVYSQSE